MRALACSHCTPCFLKLILCGLSVCVCVRVCVCVCVCVSAPRLLINSGVMRHNMDPYDWLNKFYSCYTATVTIIINGHALGIDTHV